MVERALGQGPRAALVGLTSPGLLDRADQAEGLVAIEGIDPGGAGIGNHGHVGGLDAFPAADRRAVEGKALSEGLLFQQIGADRQVLPFAVQIGELEVDQFNAFVLDLTKDVLRGLGHKGASRRSRGDRNDPLTPIVYQRVRLKGLVMPLAALARVA